MSNAKSICLTDTEANKFESLLASFLEGMPEIIIDTSCSNLDASELTTTEAQRKYIVESFGNFLDAETEDQPETIEAQWSDWRVAQGEDVQPSDSCTYQVKFEHHLGQNQMWFSILQSSLVELSKEDGEITPTGLCGLIEIRNGVPSISMGFDENQNAIHVTSNTHYELAITTDHAGVSASYGKKIRITQSESEIGINRSALANDVFGKHDFGSLCVVDSESWACDGFDLWSKNVSLVDEHGSEVYGTFKVEFSEDLCFVINSNFHTTEELRQKVANDLMTDADFEPLRVTDMSAWEIDGNQHSLTLRLEDDDCNKSKETFWINFDGNWSDKFEVSHR